MTDLAFYAEITQTAEELLTDFGKPVELVKKGHAGGMNAEGDIEPAQPDVIASGLGVKLPYRQQDIEAAGTTILTGDTRLLYQGDAPEVGMLLNWSGDTWRAVDVTPLDPAGVAVMYYLQLRK